MVLCVSDCLDPVIAGIARISSSSKHPKSLVNMDDLRLPIIGMASIHETTLS